MFASSGLTCSDSLGNCFILLEVNTTGRLGTGNDFVGAAVNFDCAIPGSIPGARQPGAHVPLTDPQSLWARQPPSPRPSTRMFHGSSPIVLVVTEVFQCRSLVHIAASSR